MYFKPLVLVLLLASVVNTAFTAGDGSFAGLESSNSLLSFVGPSNDVIHKYPSESTLCFNYYIPNINQLAKQFGEDYLNCETMANDEISALESATLNELNLLSNLTDNYCETLNKCRQEKSPLKASECYIAKFRTAIETAESINIKATKNLFDLNEKLHSIKTDKQKCTDTLERLHEHESTQSFTDLNDCISGIKNVPTTTTETAETTINPTDYRELEEYDDFKEPEDFTETFEKSDEYKRLEELLSI